MEKLNHPVRHNIHMIPNMDIKLGNLDLVKNVTSLTKIALIAYYNENTSTRFGVD